MGNLLLAIICFVSMVYWASNDVSNWFMLIPIITGVLSGAGIASFFDGGSE